MRPDPSAGERGDETAAVHPTQGGSHGDHWQSVFGERVHEVLPRAQQAFQRPIGRGSVRHQGQLKELSLARASAAPGVDVLAAALDGALITAFPVLREAADDVPASVTGVAPWPDGLEAWVEAHVAGLGYVNYFATDYIPQQKRYHEAAETDDASLRVAFSGLAYTLMPGTEEDRDDLAPAADLIAKAYPDDYWWCGHVKAVHERDGGILVDVVVEPEAGARLALPIFASEHTLEHSGYRPEAGKRASGFMWLQGHLAESGVSR